MKAGQAAHLFAACGPPARPPGNPHGRQVCFGAEDPATFAQRHVDAHRSRARAESLLRYNLYVDSMPTEDIPPLTNEQVSRGESVWWRGRAAEVRQADRLQDVHACMHGCNCIATACVNRGVRGTEMQLRDGRQEGSAERLARSQPPQRVAFLFCAYPKGGAGGRRTGSRQQGIGVEAEGIGLNPAAGRGAGLGIKRAARAAVPRSPTCLPDHTACVWCGAARLSNHRSLFVPPPPPGPARPGPARPDR